MIENYPAIKKAALHIAYDNGCINRDEPEERALAHAELALSGHPAEALHAIDTWLSHIPDADLETICMGEHSDAQKLLATAPPITDLLLTQIFEVL
jgi:hypothetical protein